MQKPPCDLIRDRHCHHKSERAHRPECTKANQPTHTHTRTHTHTHKLDCERSPTIQAVLAKTGARWLGLVLCKQTITRPHECCGKSGSDAGLRQARVAVKHRFDLDQVES